MLLKDLQTLATKLATGTLFHVEKAGKAYSVDYSALAKAIIEEYADSTVGGSKQSVQAAIGALNSRTGSIKTAKGVDMNLHKTYKITMASGESYPIFFMYGQSTGSNPFAMVISAGNMFSETPTINYNAFVGSNAVSNVTASNGVITIEFTGNYAQFSIISKHGFTGEIV